MNAKAIAHRLATGYSSPFWIRSQICVVPNLSWGMLDWEADLIAVSKSRFVTEIEIKISKSDWKSDIEKYKWKSGSKDHELIRRFFYAGPMKLMEKFEEIVMPEGSGVIGITEDRIRVLKEAEVRRNARKLNDKELLKILRLAALKAWNLNHKAEQIDFLPAIGETA